jgi:hypothetical protein
LISLILVVKLASGPAPSDIVIAIVGHRIGHLADFERKLEVSDCITHRPGGDKPELAPDLFRS